ncbi:helix-turn-helix domain-containing protein [Cohnella laeviribosi]|uniref:helix-turn-helix domain-containing protein n=1 Tax=Cohnella laeviribosi TaxID=380174 RepID=UPI003D195685
MPKQTKAPMLKVTTKPRSLPLSTLILEVLPVADIRRLVDSKIREYRKAKGLSQDQLAERCGFHYSYIGGVERGERNISLENLAKIASALELEPKTFFEFDIPIQQPPSDKKDAALQEVISILKGKDIRYIQMTKKLLVEIFKTFPRQ